ncbi:MAG: hypothetical protein JWN14_2465 [Chthonomonadales bacterium]|nr:hypothetical protein [Chthonomonadales bacterium]
MTIQERKVQDAGFGHGTVWVKVSHIPDGSPLPDGAIQVADETPLHDWKQEGVN